MLNLFEFISKSWLRLNPEVFEFEHRRFSCDTNVYKFEWYYIEGTWTSIWDTPLDLDKKKKKNKKIWMPRFLNLMLLFETGCNIKWEYMWICMLNLLNEYIMTHFHTVASKDYLHTAAILRIPSKLFINTMPSFMNCTILHLELVMLFHSLKF